MPDLQPDQLQAIDELLFAGQKIQAIKVFREATESDLATAKQFVEVREAHLHEKEPGRFKSSGGCMGVILLVVGLGSLLGWGAWALVV